MTAQQSSPESLVGIEYRGDVAILWMKDSARRNALSTDLVQALLRGLVETRNHGSRAVVLTSDLKMFCAGADIRDMLENGWLDADPEQQHVITPPDLFEAIEHDPRPIIAAVNGLALGGGVELSLACDVVIAADTASFMLPELGLGVLPNTAIARLPGLIGYRAAADLVLTRRRIDAQEALRLGMITATSSVEEVVDRAVEVAAAITAGAPPTAIAAAKRNLHRGLDWSAIKAMLGEMSTAEWREGTSAFVEKRSPDYTGFWNKV